MTDAPAAITIAGLGDLHVSERTSHPYRDLFAEIAERAQVLALCGDLTNLGRPHEAEILAEDIRTCRIPVVAVLGNHDLETGHAAEVRAILTQAGLILLDEENPVINGIGFAGVKGFGGGFGARMLSPFGEDAIKAFVNETQAEAFHLENALHSLAQETERLVVALHYSPVAETVEGEPREIWPFLGSSRLAETIDRFPVKAVLHGHAHHGAPFGRTAAGVPVFNCALPVPKETGRPYALVQV
ncbi:MAG TPA: metallophosphoesterase [Magnetospirillum sp.]|nr:metallophosphoesterase [Magnetospirillum sp.]